MAEKKVIKPVALAVGAALAGSFAISGAVNAADTAESPFSISNLEVGYMLGEGEGSCGVRKTRRPKALVARKKAKAPAVRKKVKAPVARKKVKALAARQTVRRKAKASAAKVAAAVLSKRFLDRSKKKPALVAGFFLLH